MGTVLITHTVAIHEKKSFCYNISLSISDLIILGISYLIILSKSVPLFFVFLYFLPTF